MRRMLAIAGLLLAAALFAAGPSLAWVSVGGGMGYAGPYVNYGWGSPVACLPPAFVPPAVAYWPAPLYAAPPLPWPGYGPNVAVRWNRYFSPDGPRVQGYTLPR